MTEIIMPTSEDRIRRAENLRYCWDPKNMTCVRSCVGLCHMCVMAPSNGRDPAKHGSQVRKWWASMTDREYWDWCEPVIAAWRAKSV